MQETIRTGLIIAGVAVAAGYYLKLLGAAFTQNVLWGIFALFSAPIGGLLFGLSDWREHLRPMLLAGAGAALAVVGLWYFPRQPVSGFWVNEPRTVVLQLESDGAARYFGLGTDGNYTFRPVKVLTRELPITSQVRLKVTGLRNFEVAYYDPRGASLALYDGMHDPDVFILTDPSRSGLHLTRVADAESPEFAALLDLLSQRKALYLAATGLIRPAGDGTAALALISARLRQRYEAYVRTARGGTDESLDALPAADQIYVRHIRAAHGPRLQAGAGSDAILTADLKQDFFLTRQLGHYELVDVKLDGTSQQAQLTFDPTEPGRRGQMSLPGARAAGGAWTIELAALRDADIRAWVGRADPNNTRDLVERYLAGTGDSRRNRMAP